MIELSLMAPWLLFLFAGILDMGFYLQAAICVQNASRVAAAQTSASAATAADSVLACRFALAEMSSVPNTSRLASCDAPPLVVLAASVAGIDGAPASRVSVSYESAMMVPIPGLAGRLALTRATEMRVRMP